jgi:tryptophan synthase alpha subunit
VGSVIGHPSKLHGSIEEIVTHARYLASLTGLHGLDLLAHRYDGDVDALVRAVVEAVDLPLIAAGSIDGDDKIQRLASAGVWAFTIGSAILNGTYSAGPVSVREGVKWVLATRGGERWKR